MKSFILSLLFSVFTCGCISATATDPRVCDSEMISFPSAPISPVPHILPVTRSITINFGVGSNVISNVYLLDGQITRTTAGGFGFIDDIMVTVSNPNGDDAVLWDSKSNNVTTLNIPASDQNLSKYIDSNDMLTLNAVVSTQNPPPYYWTLNASICVSAKATENLP